MRFYNEIKSTPEGAGGLWLTQKERRKGEGCSSNIVANKLLSALSRLSNDELNVFFYVLKNVDARKCAKTGKLVASFSMPGLFGELKKAGAKSINESRMRKAFVNLSKGTAGIQFREEGADFVVCAFPTFKHDRSTHTITVQINDALKSCILNLKEHYTAIDFRNIASLNGKHAKLLYLELKRHSSKPTENYPYEGGGEWSFSIGQIKAVFGLGKFSYNNDTGRMVDGYSGDEGGVEGTEALLTLAVSRFFGRDAAARFSEICDKDLCVEIGNYLMSIILTKKS